MKTQREGVICKFRRKGVSFFSLCLQLVEAGSHEGKISAFDEYRDW